MKLIISFLFINLLISCRQSESKKITSVNSSITKEVSDSVKLTKLLQNFDSSYKKIEKSLYDSVSKLRTDNIDFSCLTEGLEKKHDECKDETEKLLLGYKLAANYMIHYDSSKKMEYKQKAEHLFYSFLCFQDGELASRYMKLDLAKVQLMQKEWKSFSEQNKETLLFYGLLRGFQHGLPDVLKNVE